MRVAALLVAVTTTCTVSLLAQQRYEVTLPEPEPTPPFKEEFCTAVRIADAGPVKVTMMNGIMVKSPAGIVSFTTADRLRNAPPPLGRPCSVSPSLMLFFNQPVKNIHYRLRYNKPFMIVNGLYYVHSLPMSSEVQQPNNIYPHATTSLSFFFWVPFPIDLSD